MSFLYSWLFKAARCWTRRFDVDHAGDWDFAVPGKSIEAAMCQEELKTEMSNNLGMNSAGGLLDMARFYDSVSLSYLLTAFVHLGMPAQVGVIMIGAALAPRRLIMGKLAS